MGKRPRKQFRTERSRMTWRFVKGRIVEDAWGDGFGGDQYIIAMLLKLPRSDPEVKDYLKPQPHNEQKNYLIGASFNDGHATLVVRESDPDPEGAPPLSLPENDVKLSGHFELDDNVKLLHLRFARPTKEVPAGKNNPMLLVYESLIKRHYYSRYFDILRVQTTARMLKFIAMDSCPPLHQLLVSDCVTFAREFATGLLDHLQSENKITEDDYIRLKQEAYKKIHSMEGMIAVSEVESRNQTDVSSY